MPPLYDDIQDALVLIQDGLPHTVSLTSLAATQETNENTYIGSPHSIWLTFDVTNYLAGAVDFADFRFEGRNVQIDLSVVVTDDTTDPPYYPEIDLIRVNGVWDPTSPDFSKLDYAGHGDDDASGNPYLGDGTATPPPVTIAVFGSANDAPGVTSNGDRSKTGKWYLLVSDWNYTFSGSVDLTYRIDAAPLLIDATDDPGAGVTVSGDHLLEDTAVMTFDDLATDFPSWSDTRVTTYVRDDNLPPPGRYRVYAELRSDGNEDSFCTIRRNGLPYALATVQGFTGFTSRDLDTTVWRFVELTDQLIRSRPSERYGPEFVPILAGDEIQFSLWNTGTDTLEIRNTMWVLIEEGGTAGPPIQLLEIPDLPEGATDVVDIPDFTRWTAAHGGSGTMYSGKEICVTDNGDIYILFDEADGDIFTSPPPQVMTARLGKWSGGSFTVITDDPFDVGGSTKYRYWAGDGLNGMSDSPVPDVITAFSLDTDGTNVYVCFGKTDGTYTIRSFETDGDEMSTVKQANYLVHVYKWNGSSYAAMGSGFRAMEPDNREAQPGAYEFGNPQVRCSPAGDVWVAYVMNKTDELLFPGGDYSVEHDINVACVAHWNGSSWDDTALPFPTNPHTTGGGWGQTVYSVDCAAIDVNLSRQIDMAFIDETVCVAFLAVYDTPGSVDPDVNPKTITSQWHYSEYDGSWSAYEKFHFSDFFVDDGTPGNFHDNSSLWWEPGEQWHQGMALRDDNNGTVYLAAALGWDGTGVNPVICLKRPPGGPFEQYPTPIIPGYGGLDREGGMWSDPTGCDMCVDGDGNVWALYDSSTFNGYGGIAVVNVAENGNGDGATFAGLTNQGIGLFSEIGNYDRIYTRRGDDDGVVYAIANGSNGDFSLFAMPQIWVLPRDDVHIPWRPGTVTFLPHFYRRVLG